MEPGSPGVFLGIALGILRACVCTDVYLFILFVIYVDHDLESLVHDSEELERV